MQLQTATIWQEVLTEDELRDVNGGAILSGIAWLMAGAVADYACQELFDKSLGQLIVEGVSWLLSAGYRANSYYMEIFNTN